MLPESRRATPWSGSNSCNCSLTIPSSDEAYRSGDDGHAYAPKIVGGVVGGLLVLGLLFLAALFLRRKRRNTASKPDAQVDGADDRSEYLPTAAELSPATKKPELQCPRHPPMAEDRGRVLSPRAELEDQDGQMLYPGPAGMSGKIKSSIKELAGSYAAKNWGVERSSKASKAHDTIDGNSITDRITV